MSNTQLEINNITATSGSFTSLTSTSGSFSNITATSGSNIIASIDTINLINSTNVYLWSNFK